MKNTNRFSTLTIAQIGVMAAIVFAVTFLRIPLLGSKIHFANAMCLLGGLLLGPIPGGLAAGFGSAIYDVSFGGYGILDALITFVSKFLMAYICARIAYAGEANGEKHVRNIAAVVIGALSYVALYMLKTFVFQAFVYGYPMETVWATMLSKLPASLLNAASSIVVTPILYTALRPVIRRLSQGAGA